MIRRGLWFFLQLAVLVAIAVWLAEQSGSVSITWRDWLLETSPGMLMVFVLVLAVILLLLWRIWRGINATPHLIDRMRRQRRRTHGYAALVKSLSAIAAGEGAVALRLASEAEEVGEPALAHLAAAEAAELANDIPRALAEYERLRSRPDTALIGLRGLIGLAERRGDLSGAVDLAQQARNLAPKSPWAAHMLFTLQARTSAFADAERTLADAARLNAVPAGEADRLLSRLLLARAAINQSAGRDADALSDAERAHQVDPASTDAAIFTARLLLRAGRNPAAERVLERSWGVAPGPDLAQAWMEIAPARDTAARLRQAERLHLLDSNSAEGRMAVAEAELAAGRLAEARAHLTSLEAQPGRRYCRLMAYLESASGNEAAAAEWFRKSLALPEDAARLAVPADPATSLFEPFGLSAAARIA